MTALGIALIVIGFALMCVGLIFWRRASRTDSTDPDDAGGELRELINALEEADRDPMANVRPRFDQIRNDE